METGGQVYGNQKYGDFTEAFTNSSTEYTITIGAGQWYGTEAQRLLKLIHATMGEDEWNKIDGKYYAESMCRYVGRDIKSWRPDVIIPVPLHRRKKRMRGFNQAADLAERIGKILGIPVAEDVIYKSRETRSQKKLDAEERKKNLRNAFQAAGPVTGLRILVVDDVYTTGSTVEAMAECLLENGAKAVFFVTLCTGNI